MHAHVTTHGDPVNAVPIAEARAPATPDVA
jgi:hypothetical protein